MIWPLARSRAPAARDSSAHAGALLEPASIAETIDALLAAHSGSDRGVAVLSVCLGVLGAPDFDFDPRFEDAVQEAALVRLRAALRSSDRIGILSRTELAVILPTVVGVEQAELAALKLLRAFEVSLPWNGAARRIQAGIGVAYAPGQGHPGATLVRYARSAAQVAKTKESAYHVFEAATDGDDTGSNDLEIELRRALQENELALHYQPQINLATGDAVGAEGLARWTMPGGRAVSPGVFVPLAERRGLMSSLTSWTLSSGLRQLSAFRAAGLDFTLGLNVSPINLAESDFPEMLAQSLAMWSVPADRITLEITESTPMHDADKVLPMLQRLKSVGVRLAIDDFGTGYSSLALLRQLPVDELKIDQQFVRGMLQSDASMQIVRTVLDLAQNFGLRTIAEGVEDEATLSALRELGCNQAQGYFISRPLDDAKLVAWFHARH